MRWLPFCSLTGLFVFGTLLYWGWNSYKYSQVQSVIDRLAWEAGREEFEVVAAECSGNLKRASESSSVVVRCYANPFDLALGFERGPLRLLSFALYSNAEDAQANIGHFASVSVYYEDDGQYRREIRREVKIAWR